LVKPIDKRPRRNRVDPWGELHAHPARGTLMGNRGCLHNADGEIIRHHVGRRWITCRLAFKGRRRALMQPGRYTELFFLDEATALAAGHRPCAECRRQHYVEFLAALRRGNPTLAPSIRSADALDAALHAARWQEGQRVTFTAPLRELPPGVILLAQDEARHSHPAAAAPLLLGMDGQLWHWHMDGYRAAPRLSPSMRVTVLTPAPTVHALAAGYAVDLSPLDRLIRSP